jgi:hypothetical protein
MGQVRLWKWQHTDETFGTPVVTRQPLSKYDAYTSLNNPLNVEAAGTMPTPPRPASDAQRSLTLS